MYFYNESPTVEAIEQSQTTLPTNADQLNTSDSSLKSHAANPELIKNELFLGNFASSNGVTELAPRNRESRVGDENIEPLNSTLLIHCLIKSVSGNGASNYPSNGSPVENGFQPPATTPPPPSQPVSMKRRWTRARNLLWDHFKSGYSQQNVLVWSIWWALATGGFFMVI